MSQLTTIPLDRSSSSTPPWSMPWLDEDTTSASQKLSTRKLQPNLTRRTHKKSRAGCFSCKTRKIKCGEERPMCKQCIIKSIACVYPCFESRREQAVVKRTNDPSPTLSTTNDTFSLQDMQFFHHFLTLAYPHLPLGNDTVWVKDIPQFAQEHSFLMHAMLALGASHLDQVGPNQETYRKAALVHRGHAMLGLNKVLSKTELAYGEADAMLATCYALTFQSSHMNDGLPDFITFVRGCALATDKIRHVKAETAFDLTPDRHFAIMEPRLKRLSIVNPLHVLGGLEALQGMRGYLSNTTENKFYNAIQGIFFALKTSSSSAAYRRFVTIFQIWSNLLPDDFNLFIDSSNTIAQILLAYFIATELIMVPLTIHEWPERAGYAPARILMSVVAWLHDIASRIPDELQYHLDWPKSIVATVVAEISEQPFEGPAVLLINKKYTLPGTTRMCWSAEAGTQPHSPA